MPENQNEDTNELDNSIKSLSGIFISTDKVRVKVDLTETHSKPDLELSLVDANGNVVSRSMIMGTIEAHIEFTLHIRTADAVAPITLTCITSKEENLIDSKNVVISNP